MNVYYDRKDEWKNIIDNGMAVDYSWNVSADKYIAMYSDLTGIYDLPEKKTETPAKKTPAKKKKDDFEEKLKANAEASANAAAEAAKEPRVVKVENPFEEDEKSGEKTAAKKTTAKKTTASQKGAAKKGTAKKTTASRTKKTPSKSEKSS